MFWFQFPASLPLFREGRKVKECQPSLATKETNVFLRTFFLSESEEMFLLFFQANELTFGVVLFLLLFFFFFFFKAVSPQQRHQHISLSWASIEMVNNRRRKRKPRLSNKFGYRSLRVRNGPHSESSDWSERPDVPSFETPLERDHCSVTASELPDVK